MTKRVLHVVSNVANYADQAEPTGLWLSELTHAWHVFAEKGYDQHLVSPKGGVSLLEPRSLKWPMADASVKAWLTDRNRQALLATTARPDQIDPADFDAIYFTGGHAVMWDFPDNIGLQQITRDIYERGGVVSSVCHGYCGLLNTTLSDGKRLVAQRRVTGYSWVEEVLAGVAKKVPYNAEQEMKQRGAFYEKALLPFVSKVVTDGRLVTGQNPQSARATAERVAALL
ncbi:type 1 glutamine amidotransferase domain-containing protein [Paraburkholderia antibiotica]|uniref:Type 1 glutamine amidotransferase domain-containing protein n=1 Tax=Paraburkholderia antibiotica TaxID=2728839 RepID=A0A7X9X0R7_9BURK|nr:type 1 glutamine amidotransferase domain-containing protein [Paraburkholderia antibiotica]NML29325.1 type 1 glutamine amidotransferase domain-containing protein [Paraburkholderia antibiotica]